MNLRFLLFLSIILSVLFVGCGIIKRNIWVHNGIRAKRIQRNYLPEPLNFSSYIYFCDEWTSYKKVDVDILKNQDSVLYQTKISLLNTKLILQIKDSLQNKVTRNFVKKIGTPLRPRNVDNQMILSHIPDSQTYIFPLIYAYNIRAYHVGAFYPTSDNDFFGWSEFVVMIFIVKNKKVIYKRAVRYSELHTQTGPAITDYHSDVRLEHLGLIVEKAMEDYVKRIRKEQ